MILRELYQQSLQTSPSLSLPLSFSPHPTGLCITSCCNVRDPLSLKLKQLLYPASLPLRTLPSFHTCCINVNILLHRFPQRINSPSDAGMPEGPSLSRRELCTPSLVWSNQACTLARLGGASSSMSVNTAVH